MKTAYPRTSNPVTITLYANIPFDNTYKNHSMISNRFKYNNTSLWTGGLDLQPGARFLDRKKTNGTRVYPAWTFSDTFNFNYSNGLIGNVVMELTYEQTNANYMRVVASATDVYYYFITGISQVNADTYSLSLELDVIMTYGDDFLDGMTDIPVFTTRKHSHRYTSDGLMPYCADLKTGDDAFSGVKPSLIKNVHKLHFEHSNMKAVEGVMWLYICCDFKTGENFDDYINVLYVCHNKIYPLTMLAIPINVNSVTYKHTNGNYSVTYNYTDIVKGVKELIGKGDVHGCKISPYPPFDSISNAQIITLDNARNLTIASSSVSVLYQATGINIYEMSINGNSLIYGSVPAYVGTSTLVKLSMMCGALIIKLQNTTTYEFDELTPTTLGFANSQAPTIQDTRYTDPKLLFAPFKKYSLSSQYASNGNEFFPELIFSTKATASNGHYFWFYSVASAYIGDNNFYTRVGDGSTNVFTNYKYDKVGLLSSVNYIFPCGTNALDVFNATQSQSFYTSKVASGVTSGLAVGGGIASVVVGAGMLSTPATAGMGTGMIIGGATAIASGTAGIVQNIKSVDAKLEDLKNTPDSINVSGSNFIIDESITEDTNGLPYVIEYDVVGVIKENADDYFYNYGYQVARECYFNTELKVDMSGNDFIDNNLFGRTIFNYIQINEDITNKINANIPLIAKQKLSSIFNNGITIWNFFGNESLWGVVSVPTNTNNPDKWFLKCKLDNTEYKG